MLEQTLAALQHAHRQGIVHRDVKPENLMVTRDGVVKVADFGLARAFADAQITEAGNVIGTVQYLAPEQLQGEPADPRTDLYALGVVAFELLTGRLPFTGETPMAIAYQHIHEPMPRPSSANRAVPASLDGWVASVTEKQRELRPESAAEARRDLETEARSLPAAPPLGSLVPEVAVVPDGGVAPPGSARSDHPAETVTIPGRDPRAFEAEGPQGPVGARDRAGAPRDRQRGMGLVDLSDPARGRRTQGRRPHRPECPGAARGRGARRSDDGGPALDEGSRGSVLEVHPVEGTTLERGDRVTLVPSLGPPPVPVPNLVGLPLADAKGALREAHLKVGEVTRAFNERFDAEHVVRQAWGPTRTRRSAAGSTSW